VGSFLNNAGWSECQTRDDVIKRFRIFAARENEQARHEAGLVADR
jgi:hypothetical protein